MIWQSPMNLRHSYHPTFIWYPTSVITGDISVAVYDERRHRLHSTLFTAPLKCPPSLVNRTASESLHHGPNLVQLSWPVSTWSYSLASIIADLGPAQALAADNEIQNKPHVYFEFSNTNSNTTNYTFEPHVLITWNITLLGIHSNIIR